jgi:hypothetical protein
MTCAPHKTGTYLALVSMGQSLAEVSVTDPVQMSDDRLHALRMPAPHSQPRSSHEVWMVSRTRIRYSVSGVCIGFDLSSLRSSYSAARQNSSSLSLGMPAASQSLYARAAISCSVGFAISSLQVRSRPGGWGFSAGTAQAGQQIDWRIKTRVDKRSSRQAFLTSVVTSWQGAAGPNDCHVRTAGPSR